MMEWKNSFGFIAEASPALSRKSVCRQTIAANCKIKILYFMNQLNFGSHLLCPKLEACSNL